MSTQAPHKPTKPVWHHPSLRRFIKVTLWLSALLCLLLVAASFYLLGTASGLRQLISLSQSGLPGKLEVQQIEGTVFDNLNLGEISYVQSEMELTINRVVLDWEPSALLTRKLHIVKLLIEQPVITQTESTQPDSAPSSSSPILDDLILPLQLQIDLLQVSQLAVNNPAYDGQSETATLISNIQLTLHSDLQTLILDQLSVITPQANAEISGQLQPSGQYPVELNTHWSLALPEKQALSGQGSIKGEIKGNLSLQQTLSGLLSTQLSASFQDLLEKPKGQLHISDFKTELGQFSPELTGSTLGGSAEVEGDMKQAKLHSHWQANLPNTGETYLTVKLHFSDNIVQIDQLDISLPEKEGTSTQSQNQTPALKMQGNIDISKTPINFNINGHWNNLRYPLTGIAEYQSDKGQLEIKGDLNHYELSINSSISGANIPPGSWRLTGTGSDRELKELQLTGQTLEGSIKIQGEASWQPQLSWNLKANGQQLNPGSFWSEWPGKLDFKAALNGSQSSGQPLKAQLLLESFSGVLRGESISAQTTAKLNGNNIAIPTLHVNVATTEIKASGSIDEKLDLAWTIHSPDLNQLMPGLKGKLNATGSLTGTQKQPHLKASLTGQNLEFENNQSASLAADLNVSLSSSYKSHIKLAASDLNIAGNHWKRLTIDGQGSTDKHQLSLETDEGPADLQLNLSGRWKDSVWTGVLNHLNINQADIGEWKIQQTAPVSLSSSNARLDSLCLESMAKESSALCVKANWSSINGIEGAINSQRFSLNHLQPWIPNQAELKGYIQVDATFSQSKNKPPRIKGSATIKGAELLLEEDDLHIIAEEIALHIDGKNNQLVADILLPLQQPTGNLEARIDIDDLSNTKKLHGDLNLTLNDLKFVSLFAPVLQAVTGQINSKLSIDGTVDQPIIQGHLTLSDATTDLPALGIKLDGVSLSVIGEPGENTLHFKGKMLSGKGPIELNGEYNPVTDTGEFLLEGRHFQAIATEDIQAWISPDIKLNIDQKQIKLRGELTIPEASIKPPNIEASSRLSDDVVIIDPTGKNQPIVSDKRTLDAQLRITLGDKVYLEALGFEGRLLGSILVEDDSRRATRATGIMQVATGQYKLYGQDLNIDRGSLIYSGGPVDNPGLDLRVSRTVDDVIAGAKVSGTLNEPRLKLFSEPAMPESSQLSYLMFGHAPGTGGNAMTEQELLFKAASALTLKGGNTIAETISETFNIDELGVAGGDTATDTSLYIGKYLSPRLYVKYGVGLLEPTHTFFMRYKLNDAWSVETQTATEHNGGDLIYTLER